MSADTPNVSRRSALIGGAALATSLGAIGLPLYLRHRYPPTPYDDLFARLPDRAAALRIGQGVLKSAGAIDKDRVAKILRAELRSRPLNAAMADDLAQGRLIEAGGWVLPDSFGNLCALAASVG